MKKDTETKVDRSRLTLLIGLSSSAAAAGCVGGGGGGAGPASYPATYEGPVGGEGEGGGGGSH